MSQYNARSSVSFICAVPREINTIKVSAMLQSINGILLFLTLSKKGVLSESHASQTSQNGIEYNQTSITEQFAIYSRLGDRRPLGEDIAKLSA